MKKNVASQSVGAQMVNASTGADFTGTVTVYVTGDSGTQAIGSVASGVCTHEGNGYHSYAPAQAETNYDHIAFTFKGTGALTHTVQVFTGFPQTGDSYPKTSTIGNGTMTVVSPVSDDGEDVSIRRGDDYLNADGRAISFTFSGAPSITGATVTFRLVDGTEIAMTVSSSTAAYLERTAAQTTAMSAGAMQFEIDAVLSNGHAVTLGTGKLTVVNQL